MSPPSAYEPETSILEIELKDRGRGGGEGPEKPEPR